MPPLRLQPRSHSSRDSDRTCPKAWSHNTFCCMSSLKGGKLAQLWNKFGKPDHCLAYICPLCTLIPSSTLWHTCLFWNKFVKPDRYLAYLCPMHLTPIIHHHGTLIPIFFTLLSSSAVDGCSSLLPRLTWLILVCLLAAVLTRMSLNFDPIPKGTKFPCMHPAHCALTGKPHAIFLMHTTVWAYTHDNIHSYMHTLRTLIYIHSHTRADVR